MQIRPYQPGDEAVQAEIYNAAAAELPAFKPATAAEVGRRYCAADFDPSSKLYGMVGDRVVGYVTFEANGRMSYPWCRPETPEARKPLLEAALSAMARRGLPDVWSSYRADWEPILGFLQEHGFSQSWEMINYVAELDRLPRDPIPPGQRIATLARSELAEVLALGGDLFRSRGPELLEGFFLRNPYLNPTSLYTLRRISDGELLGAALAVINPRFADPTKLDAAMPCFRLGALGTESERHKRVNGLVSCLFASEAAGATLLAEAARRLRAAGLTHCAAQAPSDRPDLIAFYDRHFRRQGSFPILIHQPVAAEVRSASQTP